MRRDGAATYDVAIYAPTCAPMYLDGPTTGGAEQQMTMLASSLAGLGLRVCHVVTDLTGLPTERHGVEIVREAPNRPGDSPWRRVRDVMAALSQADARVYIQRSSGLSTAFVGAFARYRRRAFIFSVSSPQGLTGRHGLPHKEWLGFKLGLPCAHAVVIQTEEQARWAGHLRNVVRIPSFSQAKPASPAERQLFLWVGRRASYKNPMAFVDLARAVPEAAFLMVGIDSASTGILAAAAAVENLTVLPPTAHHELTELYQRAVAVVNTSDFEGFPNTFLEGWAHGALALSLRVDPDSLIVGRGLGVAAGGSMERLVEGAREMWRARGAPDSRRRESVRYVNENHAPAVVARRWYDLVRQLEPTGFASPPDAHSAQPPDGQDRAQAEPLSHEVPFR